VISVVNWFFLLPVCRWRRDGRRASAFAETEITNPSIEFESGETHTHKSTDDLKTGARPTADKYRGKAEQAWNDAQERVHSLQKEIEQEVRKKPTKGIFTVLGIGFLLGLIFRRR